MIGRCCAEWGRTVRSWAMSTACMHAFCVSVCDQGAECDNYSWTRSVVVFLDILPCL